MRKTRTGFTLVELLVVMALIAIVATMAVMFFPNAATAQREANAAQQLQGWLNIAKQRALRNQRPAGLRLWISTATVNANTFPNVVTECQYIEQPDDIRTGTLASVPLFPVAGAQPMNPSYKTVNDVLQLSGVDLTNGYGTPLYNYLKSKPGFPNLPMVPPGVGLSTYPPGPFVVGQTFGYDPHQVYWTVQPCPFVYTGKGYYPFAPNPLGFGGDYLEVYNNGIMHQVVAVLAVNNLVNPVVSYIQIWPPLPNALASATSNFRIMRGPRVVGTETLTFPDNTFIDLNTNGAYNNPLPNLANSNANTGAAEVAAIGEDAANTGTGFVDILFSPSGQVITPGVATSNLHLWVRCPSESAPIILPLPPEDIDPYLNPFRGDPTIVSVFVRTGFVGAYKVAPPPAFTYATKLSYPPAAPVPFTVDPYSLVK